MQHYSSPQPPFAARLGAVRLGGHRQPLSGNG